MGHGHILSVVLITEVVAGLSLDPACQAHASNYRCLFREFGQ